MQYTGYVGKIKSKPRRQKKIDLYYTIRIRLRSPKMLPVGFLCIRVLCDDTNGRLRFEPNPTTCANDDTMELG